MFFEKLDKFASRFLDLWIIKSIKNAFLYILPVTLIGAFSLLLLNFPIPNFQNYMNQLFDGHWDHILNNIYNGTFSVISVITFICISYQLASTSKIMIKSNIPSIFVVITVFCSYMSMVVTTNENEELVHRDLLSTSGIFNSIIFSVLLTLLFIFIYKHRPFKKNSYDNHPDLLLSKAMKIFSTSILTFLIAVTFRAILHFFNIEDINATHILDKLFTNNSSFSTYLYIFLKQFLWIFGIHGANAMQGITSSLFAGDLIGNKIAIDTFVSIGGTGAGLCLLLALMIMNKNKNTKVSGWITIPVIFNINEFMIFGIPIVLNPFFIIPFVFTPLALAFTTFLAINTGFISIINTTVSWTEPIFFSGYMTTGSVNGILLQVLNLVLGILIYVPFINPFFKHMEKLNKMRYKKFLDIAMKETNYKELLKRRDEIGIIARLLKNDLAKNFDNKKNNYYMQYQSQINKDEKIVGVEALLRFYHPSYGMIPPPVIVNLLREENYEIKLGYWIIEECLKVQQKLIKQDINIILSMNISNYQLADINFIDYIEYVFGKYNINPNFIKFELLENEDILDTDNNKEIIAKLDELGCNIAIDDFGMGHSTLMYIKRFHINTIKIDGILTKDVVNNTESRSIIKSICDLATELEMTTIAEFVETKEQRDILLELGCEIYQGYYYSKPLGEAEFMKYVKKYK